MATDVNSAQARANSKSRPARAPRSKRWWERILLYPTLAVALITAGPQWISQIRMMAEGLIVPPDVADQQAALWKKNLACSAAPFAWFNSVNNVKVDTTTCDSGDVLVRALTPQNGSFFKWVALDDVIKSDAGKKSGGLIPSANAATLSLTLGQVVKPRINGVRLAQPEAKVLCQKFIDARHLMRRVSTPEGCFDEVIDTFNGQVVSRTSVPCNPQC